MDIKTPKELAKLADICRKKGIAEIKITKETVEFKLWDHVPKLKRREKDLTDSIKIENEPSQEDLLFWSSGGISESFLKG